MLSPIAPAPIGNRATIRTRHPPLATFQNRPGTIPVRIVFGLSCRREILRKLFAIIRGCPWLSLLPLAEEEERATAPPQTELRRRAAREDTRNPLGKRRRACPTIRHAISQTFLFLQAAVSSAARISFAKRITRRTTAHAASTRLTPRFFL